MANTKMLHQASYKSHALSLASHLPAEVLEMIYILRVSDHHSEDRGYSTSSVPSWVNVSYVCRRWRNVALNCPTLWSYLFLTSPRWTEELLARSKHASLKLCLNLSSCDGSSPELRFLYQVMDHAEHIQEFHLHIPDLDDQDDILSGFSSCAPRLQSLKISTNPAFFFPSALSGFSGGTPALRTLELSYCLVPLHFHKLSSLTTLSMHCVPFEQRTEDILAALSGMRDLTHLYLDRSLPSAVDFLSSEGLRSFQTIDLPRLLRLLIDAPLSTVTAFMSCVNIPLKTEVRLHCHDEHGTSLGDYAALTSLLRLRFGRLSPPIRSVTMQTDTQWYSAILTFSASECDRDLLVSSRYGMNWHWDCDIPLQIVISPAHMERIIPDMCCSVPWENVHRLHVTFPPFAKGFWSQILGHFRDLRYLKLSRGDMPQLASVLSVFRGGKSQDRKVNWGMDRVVVPALAELELYDVLLWSPLERCTIFEIGDDPQSLYDALASRKASQGQLTMTRCRVTKFGRVSELSMIGRWEGGQFHVVEERTS